MDFTLEGKAEDDISREEVSEVTESAREIIRGKLREHFDGKIVRKDLTKKIKEGANVPVYVLEFLLGQYCSSDDEEIIENGIQRVKRHKKYFPNSAAKAVTRSLIPLPCASISRRISM